MLKLYLIDKPDCHDTKDLIPGIFAVAEMERRFDPYLQVEYLPEKYGSGVILVAGHEIIKRNWTFDDPRDKLKLKALLWHYLRKYHNIIDITDKHGCIKDFKKVGRFKVIQGWQAKRRDNAKYHIECTPCVDSKSNGIPSDSWIMGNVNRKKTCAKINRVLCRDICDIISYHVRHFLIQHPVYKDDPRNVQTRDICMKVRGEKCGNNFPPNSAQFRRCMDEVVWLCTRGYPPTGTYDQNYNTRTKIVSKYRQALQHNILKYLKKNNLRTNKQVLDIILSNGFFERIQTRMGNRYSGYKAIKHAVDDTMNEFGYYKQLIEGYSKPIKCNYIYILIFIILYN